MDRSRLQLAIQLLVKAESTDAEAEAVALAERSYRLLAEVITKHDLELTSTGSGPRRRERRFLRDRRADRRGVAAETSPIAASTRSDPGGRFGRGVEAPTDRRVDFRI